MDRVLASDLVKLAKTEPQLVLDLIELAGGTKDAEVLSLTHFARGRALYELARNAEAIEQYLATLDLCTVELRDRVVISLAAAHLAAGLRDVATTALLEVETSCNDAVVRQLASCQLALIELGVGDVRAARDRLSVVVPILEADSDEADAAARALGNLAYCELTLGDLDQAATTYSRTIELAQRGNETNVVAGCLQNLAYIDVLRGHFPNAIAGFQASHDAYVRIGSPSRSMSSLFDDMAEGFGLAGLTNDAVRCARNALAHVVDGANHDKIAEAELRLAACLLDAGDPDSARELSGRAAGTFEAAGRATWAHRATQLEIEAAPSTGLSDDLIERGSRAFTDLAQHGWALDAQRVRNTLANGLLEAGEGERAAALMAGPDPELADSTVGAVEQALARVLRAEAAGTDVDGELQVARTLLWAHQLRLADPELRAGVGRLRERFRAAALRDALRSGDAGILFEAEDSWRALGTSLPRVLPLPDDELAMMSQEVRRADATVAADPDDIAAALRRHELEQKLRGTSLAGVRESETTTPPAAVSADVLAAQLDDRVFVQWIDIGSRLHGVAIVDGSVATWRLPDPAAALARRADLLLGDMRRVLRAGLPDERIRQRWATLKQDAESLGASMTPPNLPVGRGWVVSPARRLGSLPYGLLFPQATSMHMTVSASSWSMSKATTISGDVAVFVGPDLRSGTSDTRGVLAAFPAAAVHAHPDATTDALRAAIPNAAVLHIAAHGEFRPDSPLFSSIALSDGRFTLYELPESGAPDLVTLASCNSGRSLAYIGGEIVGIVSAWLHAGSRRVIAPVCPIPDVEAAAVTAHLYSNLAGRSPEAALAHCQITCADESPIAGATAAVYQSWGPDVGLVSSTGAAPSAQV